MSQPGVPIIGSQIRFDLPRLDDDLLRLAQAGQAPLAMLAQILRRIEALDRRVVQLQQQAQGGTQE